MTWWKPDTLLTDKTVSEITKLSNIVGSSHGSNANEMLQLLEQLGRLAFMGLRDQAESLIAQHKDVLATKVQTALSVGLSDEKLDAASFELGDLAMRLGLADDDVSEIEMRIIEALTLREQIELALEGARILAGDDFSLEAELESSILAFDDSLSPELWRFLPLGDLRMSRASWVAPEFRQRMWWWHKGADLPQTALQDMVTVARVIHAFPEARIELGKLIQAESDLSVGSAPLANNTVSIRDHLLRQRKQRKTTTPPEAIAGVAPLRFAAADAEIDPIFEQDGISLSSNGELLFVDLESPLVPGDSPVAVIEAGDIKELVGAQTEFNSYEFPMSSPHFEFPKARLRVNLSDGVVYINLHLENDD